jgi:hypothetical protein
VIPVINALLPFDDEDTAPPFLHIRRCYLYSMVGGARRVNNWNFPDFMSADTSIRPEESPLRGYARTIAARVESEMHPCVE